MSKYEDLWEEYSVNLKRLQDTCPHNNLHDWMEECWAMGHSTGRNVQCCKECNKIVNFNIRCEVCHKLLVNDEMKTISSDQMSDQTHFFGAAYCEECISKPDPRVRI